MRKLSLIIFSCLILVTSFTRLSADSGLKLIWKKAIDKKVEKIWSLNNFDHLLIEGDGHYYLVDKKDGNILWENEYKDVEFSFVIKQKNILVLIKQFELFLIYPFTGNEVKIPVMINDPNNLQYIEQMNQLIILQPPIIMYFDPENGKMIRRTTFRSKIERILDHQYDHENGTLLLFAQSGNKKYFLAIDAAEGKVKWETKLKVKLSLAGNVPEQVKLHAALNAKPFIQDDHIYLELGGLSKIEYETGKVNWYTKYGSINFRSKSLILNANAQPIFKDDHIFTAAKGVIRCIDLNTGKIKWQSQKYNLTPTLFTQKDTIYTVTGGTFPRIHYGMTFWQFLTAVAIGTITGVTTGTSQILVPELQAKTDIGLSPGKFENISVKDLENSIIRKGKPGLVACNIKNGIEFYRFRAKNKLTGIYINFPQAILADQENIYEFNIKTAETDTPITLKDWEIEGEIAYLLKNNEKEYIVITINPKGIQKGYSVIMTDLDSKEPVWQTLIQPKYVVESQISVKKNPIFLSKSENNLYLIAESTLISIDMTSGNIKWEYTLPEKGWSLYLADRSFVYFNKGKLFYSKFND